MTVQKNSVAAFSLWFLHKTKWLIKKKGKQHEGY